MKDIPRILHVLGGLNRGGAETMVMNIYRAIDSSLMQFDFVVHTKEKCDYNDEILSMGGRIHYIPQYTGTNHMHYKKAWIQLFENYPEYKIIHGHVRSTASIYLRIAKRKGLVTIAHSHSTSSGSGFPSIIKNILQYPIRYIADYLFACSKSAGKWLFGKNSINRDNFYILKNAIDTEKFIYDEKIRLIKREELKLKDKFVVGHIGRFTASKNHELLIDIFKFVHDRDNNAVLLLIGDGELRPKIENKIRDMSMKDCVIFIGKRSDVSDLLQAMDIFVFPSFYEGLGIAAIEAQVSGLPCLVSNTIPEEVFITRQIESLDLNCSLSHWGNRILNYKNYIRRNKYEESSFNGYDINETTNWLQNFYLEKLR